MRWSRRSSVGLSCLCRLSHYASPSLTPRDSPSRAGQNERKAHSTGPCSTGGSPPPRLQAQNVAAVSSDRPFVRPRQLQTFYVMTYQGLGAPPTSKAWSGRDGTSAALGGTPAQHKRSPTTPPYQIPIIRLLMLGDPRRGCDDWSHQRPPLRPCRASIRLCKWSRSSCALQSLWFPVAFDSKML
jgi:hypothetical protein